MRKTFFKELASALQINKIEYRILKETNDIWAVDYMPIQVEEDKFILFRYEPDYLQTNKFLKSQTDNNKVCEFIGVNPIKSNLVIDGGNIIKGKKWIILTEKIFSENNNLEKHQVIHELEKLFDTKVIIIPREPNDFTGHADGILRHYDDETVLINNYRVSDKKAFQAKLNRTLKNEGINSIPITYNPYRNADYTSANGLYINFLQMKGSVFLPFFRIPEDEIAHKEFESLFPDYVITPIDSREISKEGGVLNCITWNILN